MKKWIWIICFITITILCGCSGGSDVAKNTLMVYMIGSDLEAKGASGTNDMKEMLESQVDLSKNNVVVYAGGTKKWHNDHLTAETGHTMLKLTSSGFETVLTFSEASMGDAKTLSDFLNHAYKEFPAENYSLILWDHGNGPLIGYGKDMLHEDDSLTLTEMKEAMNDSPFRKDKKLSWVGFDACLMSSLELACTWSDYAEYLVASQEIEPAFGWNYSFLKDFGKKETKDFLKGITEQYITTCLGYYTERGYDQRDTTLACIDLSAVQTLRNSFEKLSSKTSVDVKQNYGKLVSQRVKTRALGRATTGSEYDLIDLMDMAEQLKELYPKEAKDVQKAIEDAVVANATNTVGCCGISIYYPFYNKNYYEKTWGDVYSKLGLLPEYTAYLSAYAQQWLGNDMLLNLAQSIKPSISSQKYVLQLNAEQADAYAEAQYYILAKEGEELYTKIYSSKAVRKTGEQLVADFDGQILYGKNKFDEYFIPVAVEHDTVGGQTRYSIYANLTNQYATLTDKPEGFEQKVLGHRFHISADAESKDIKMSALVPYNIDVDTKTLTGGKLEDADLSKWSQYFFLQERHRYMERYDNGAIKPVDEWKTSDYYSANTMRVDDGLEFLFAPIPDGEYYLIFEIKDKQGNRYCSEPLTIDEKGNSLQKEYTTEVVEASWDSGKEVKLLKKEGVTVYLTSVEKYGKSAYALKVKNDNKYDIAFLGHELMFNGKVYCPDGSFGYFIVPAGKTVVDEYGISFGDAADLKITDNMSSLQLLFSVVTARGNKTIIYEQECNVAISRETAIIPSGSFFDDSYGVYSVATRGILATEQLIFEKDGLKVYLMGFGGNGKVDSHLVAALRFENTASVTRHFSIDGMVMDDIYVDTGTGPISILPGTTSYKNIILSEDKLNEHMISSPATLSLNVTHMQYATLKGGGGFSNSVFYDIQLKQRGSGSNFKEGNTVLYKENDVCISLIKCVEEYGKVYWYCTVVNESDKGIAIDASNVLLNGKKVNTDELLGDFFTDNGCCGPGQKTIFEICCKSDKTIKLEFQPIFYDLSQEKILWKGNTKLQLKY